MLEIVRLEAEDARPSFSCGDQDLDEFFHHDSIEGCKQLVCVTYAVLDNNENIVAYFSLSNDSIRKEEMPRSARERLLKVIPREKRYSGMPAAKIGRLGVSVSAHGNGYGRVILDFLKGWFTNKNKTGCRFLVVDAYNNEKAISFYSNNGFVFLSGSDENERTRIMYYDLIQFRD